LAPWRKISASGFIKEKFAQTAKSFRDSSKKSLGIMTFGFYLRALLDSFENLWMNCIGFLYVILRRSRKICFFWLEKQMLRCRSA
jgi:hypothetical protein